MNIYLFILLSCSIILGELGKFAFIPVYLFDITFAFVLLPFLWQKNISIPKFSKFYFLFLLICIFSIVINSFQLPTLIILRGFFYCFRMAYYGILALAIYNNSTAPRIWYSLVYYAIVLVASIGILLLFINPDVSMLQFLGWDPHYYRLVSTYFEPNFLASILLIGLFVGFILYKKNISWFTMQGILLLSLYLTYSRSGIVGFVVGTLLFLMFSSRSKKILIGLLLFLFVVIVVPKPGGDTLRLDRFASTVARVDNWKTSIYLFINNPLFGIGFGSGHYKLVQMGLLHESASIESKAQLGFDSSLFSVGAFTGIVGLYFFVRYLIELVASGVRGDNKEFLVRGSTIALFGSLFVTSFFVNVFFYSPIMLLISILSGAFGREAKK